MSSPPQQDRPTGRARPRPAHFDTTDPATATPEPGPSDGPPAPGGTVGPVPTVALSTRISVAASTLLTTEARRSGRSKRDLIEHALHATYPGPADA